MICRRKFLQKTIFDSLLKQVFFYLIIFLLI